VTSDVALQMVHGCMHTAYGEALSYGDSSCAFQLSNVYQMHVYACVTKRKSCPLQARGFSTERSAARVGRVATLYINFLNELENELAQLRFPAL
jgi:hypothetical protein